MKLEAVSVGIVVADAIARVVIGTPEKGKLALVDEILLCSGGSAASTGYALARFAVPTAVIGRIGADGFGDFLVSETTRHGAESHFIRDANARTSATQVLVDETGERTFLHAIGANANLCPEDVPLEALQARGARLLHLAGFYALTKMDNPNGEPAKELFARAKKLGFTTSLDNVWDATGQWSRIKNVLPYTDIFCPSIHDAAQITGQSEPLEIAKALFEMGVQKIVALKIGEAGSLICYRQGQTHRLESLPVQAVDGTGSGDAFIAGFLAGFLRNQNLLRCGQLGNAAGAMCVQAIGAMTGITDWANLEQMADTVKEKS